jgi:hypothetical protein
MAREAALSVVTIGFESAADCRMVIGELARQTRASELEAILVAPDREGISEDHIESFGAWQWVTVPEIRICGVAMAAGFRLANAPYVTYAEEHTYLNEDWAEQVLAAHEKGYSVVGFVMENANPETLTSWGHLYGQFGPVVAPVESGESDFLAGHHVSYNRRLLLEYGDSLEEMLEDESALFLDLRSKGVRMYVAGEAISSHVNISSLPAFMLMDYLGQRSFAGARAKAGNWSRLKRLAYASAFPLIPLVRLRRILGHIRRSGRQKELLPRILGPIGLALSAGAWGEMLGYLIGPGDAAERKAPAELQRENFLSKQDHWSKAG